jgi:hypothetical protein
MGANQIIDHDVPEVWRRVRRLSRGGDRKLVAPPGRGSRRTATGDGISPISQDIEIAAVQDRSIGLP